MEYIARIKTDFNEKFGIPRQSGLVDDLLGEIVFEPKYRVKEALKGLEEYSHLWVIWDFSEVSRLDKEWTPTVYPPRLGGKESRGVFATRSPFRPNPIGLSCVKIEKIILESSDGPKIIVSGVDMLNDTPVYDIKPYLPYADSVIGARGSFGEAHKADAIDVECEEKYLSIIPNEKKHALIKVLSQDPRAAYNKKEDYVYGMNFAGFDVRFVVKDNVLKVIDIVQADDKFAKIK